MANFKSSSSSSGFVIGTTVLLLLIVINIHGAPACSNSSKVMLFNSSSLEVAKDQGITEFAIDHDHDHEIQRRVLQGGIPGILGKGSLNRQFTDLVGNMGSSLQPTSEAISGFKDMYKEYCTESCLNFGANEGSCPCRNGNRDSKNFFKYVDSSCGTHQVYYCCDNVKGCIFCCGGISDNLVNQQVSTTPYASSGSPIASVDMTVIAIFTTISYMFFF